MHVWARLDLPMRFIAACCLALVLATGCSQKVRSFFFDGVESGPLPPTTKVRQNLLRENQQLERELEKIKRELEIAKNIDDKDESEPLAAEKAQNWPEASELLPKHKKSGQVDWGKALHDGIVAPRSGLRLDTPRQAVLDFNVKIARAGGGFAVNFAHNAHTEWLSCDACHPAIFPLERDDPRPVITMSKIADGQYCGACHGKVVFGVKNACARCHGGTSEQAEWKPEGPPRAPIERVAGWDAAAKLLPVTMGAPDWSKALNDGIVDPRAGLDESVASQPVLPLDINLIPANNPLFAVTFPHQAHTEWLGCNNCHAGIFQMKRGANPITMTKINNGEFCGECHGKVAFSLEACGRCHTAIPVAPQWNPQAPPRAPIEQVAGWDAAAKLLPVTAGTPDWSKALNDGIVDPRAGLDESVASQPVLPLDIDLIPANNPMFEVTFPHQAHTEWLGCDNCHTEIFQMKRGASPITMTKINNGEFCGVCHGKVAFSLEACGRCHTAIPVASQWNPQAPPRAPIEQVAGWDAVAKLLPVTAGTPDWSKALNDGIIDPRAGLDESAASQPALPLDIDLIPADNPMFEVTFPHQAHTEWLGCDNCHTEIFEMKRGANPITMTKINNGEFCGVCHGKVAFSLEACGRCHTRLAGG